VSSPIRVQVSRPVRGTGPDGSSKITFNVDAVNDGQAEATIYVFVAAYNMAPRPPTRGIWPVEAAPELNNSSHALIVAQPKRGFPVTLRPKATLETYGEITAPPGRSLFDAYQVVIYDAEGRKVRDDYSDL
jgi:hypothetical protein